MTDPSPQANSATDDLSNSSRFRIPPAAWLGMLCLLVSSIAVILMIWVPRVQRKRAVEEVERLGGSVFAEPTPAFWGARLLGELTGESEGRVVVVDLSSAHLSDETVRVVRAFPAVETVSLGGPDLTDNGLQQLTNLRSMRRLILVNCPKVTNPALDALISENPGLVVSRRGPALLGIMGRRSVVGCMVTHVRPGTAAASAGLKPGDVITRIGRRRIGSFESLAEEVARHQPGDRVMVTISRKSRQVVLPVSLGSWQ